MIDLFEWSRTIIDGPGGFVAFDEREWPIFNDTRDVEIVKWTLRCLANPANTGSAEVLAAIQKRREKVLLEEGSQP